MFAPLPSDEAERLKVRPSDDPDIGQPFHDFTVRYPDLRAAIERWKKSANSRSIARRSAASIPGSNCL
jgi:hypothetical protein